MTVAIERPHLRELRMAQGWTQQDVADRMARLEWARHRKPGTSRPLGVNADMVGKWERGEKGVSSRYRVLLAEVFKVTVDQLGLPGAARSQDAIRRDDQSLVALVDQAADLLGQLGEAGRAVRPQILAALTDDVLSRRTTLAVIDTPAPALTPPAPAELDALADQYEAAHATAVPAALMTALTAHLRMVGDALGRNPSAGTRQRLLRNRARVALLAGRIAAENLNNPMAARAYYSQATDDAYELADHHAAATAHEHAAFLALTEGQVVAAKRHRDAASRLGRSYIAVD